MKLYTINTGYFKLDGGAMFGVVPKVMWNKLNPADENNLCSWAMRCLLIEDGDRLILIDNGIGDKQDEKFLGHYHLHGTDTLDSSLAKHGFSKNDITDVFLTHLHFDHCGGSIKREGDQLVPAFKNATFWSNECHWEWATKPNDREKASFLKENILPIQESGQLKFINGDNYIRSSSDGWTAYPPSSAIDVLIPFSESISIRLADGHTSSMMLPQIKYKDKTIVYMADLLPSVAHLPIPYVMAYDTRPMHTLNEKKDFLLEAVTKDFVLFFEHDPQIECCTLQQTEKGIRMKEGFNLSELG
ncbi:MAG: MBL fold metallo-hydrolase [Chitinophagaceae bacterium]|jgi:glyoxylase-like metal-dependent hydrolase (beta-lactamase superfamily II)|nr:MBL fold metallo-hydrolase [Chitinophagaceae bacterium]